MRKISGHVVSTKPVTLSRAAKLVSRFAAFDNGSSPAVSMYLQRAADAFNQLVQFHEKRPKIRNIDSDTDRKSVAELQTDGLEKNLDGDKSKDSENRVKKGDIKNLDEAKSDGDGAKGSERSAVKEEEKKKKKKKRKKKSDEADLKEKSSRKKSRDEAVDS